MAARYGLQAFDLSEYRGDIKLNSIIVGKGSRSKGTGTAAMTDLCRFADEHGKRILLTPADPKDFKDDGPSSRARLVRFYKRFGFKDNSGRARDYSTTAGMIREPTGGRLTESLSFTHGHSGAYKDQHDMHLYAERDGAVVGRIDYSLYHGEVSIKMIEVPRLLQKSGIGSAMMRELQREYPDVEIDWGSMTAAGAALRNSLPHDEVEVPDVRAKLDRMAALKAQMDRFQAAVDRFEAGPRTEEQRQALVTLIEPWNDLHDEYARLEDETRWLKPTKRLVRTTSVS